jgi:hypothetical protein
VIIEEKLIASLNVCIYGCIYVYIVKVTEENMADLGGVSVTSIKTESLTTVAV